MTAPADNSVKIGRATRALVEAYLAPRAWAPPRDFFEKIEVMATALARWGVTVNLTSAPEAPAELAFHIIDSLAPLLYAESIFAPAEELAAGRRVLDLGSGAGFPGLVLAAATAATFTLVEARRKRASFLAVTAAEMGLGNVRVESVYFDPTPLEPTPPGARADDGSGRDPTGLRYDVVTARAFAQPAGFFRAAAAPLGAGGLARLYAGPRQRTAIEAALGDAFTDVHFCPYTVPRGAAAVAHLLVGARRVGLSEKKHS